jgi:hypothetical protein
MAVTLQCIKSATAFLSYLKVNGFVGGASWSDVVHLLASYQYVCLSLGCSFVTNVHRAVYSVRTSMVPSSKQRQ